MLVSEPGIVHIADIDIPMRSYGHFQQACHPVAFIIFGLEVLHFASECVASAELVLHVSYEDVGHVIAVHVAVAGIPLLS